MRLQDALLGVTKGARGWLKAWAKDFTDEEATEGGTAGLNPIAWQLGHVAATQDDVYCLFTGDQTIVPKTIRGICGTGCPAPTAETTYPPISELWMLLERTQDRLIGLIKRSSEADFDRPPLKENPFFHSMGQAIYEIALHENYHVGTVAALRKALGKTAIA